MNNISSDSPVTSPVDLVRQAVDAGSTSALEIVAATKLDPELVKLIVRELGLNKELNILQSCSAISETTTNRSSCSGSSCKSCPVINSN